MAASTLYSRLKACPFLTFTLVWLLALTMLLAPGQMRSATTVDMLVRGGTIVTMDAQRRVIPNGFLAVQGNRIVAVGTAAEAGQYRAKTVIEASGKAVLPGLINAHTHVPMTLFRGLADDLALQEWLTKFIFPAEAKNVTREMVRAGTRLACLEMIRSGTTCFVDMYYFEEDIAEVTEAAGLRAILGQTVIDFPVPDALTPQIGLARAEQFIQKYKAGHPLITPAVAPHAPYTCAPETLIACRKLADRHGVPLVIHLAEADTETQTILERYGKRPIPHVERVGLLGTRTIAAHVVQAQPDEYAILKRYNVGIAHCPQSNMKLAAGIAPVPEMRAVGLAVGLGTDGAASNNDLDMFEEMDTAAKLHKVVRRDPATMPAEAVLEMATIEGARAIHMADQIGSLEAGKLADFIIVDVSNPRQLPNYRLASTLVYATKSSDVETVVVNGKLLMRDRRLLTLDEAAIRRETAAFRARILQSLQP
jgi:Cytosine deaminase and related metal-dependent hydrolases